MLLGMQTEVSTSVTFKPITPTGKVSREAGHWVFFFPHQAFRDQVGKNVLSM
jgi:hypothetical protein